VSVSSTSDSPPTVVSLEDCSVELVRVHVTAALPDDVDAVDKNGNKLDGDESSAASQRSVTAADGDGRMTTDACGDSASVPAMKSHGVTLTPLNQLMNVAGSSPLRELTPSKQQGSSARSLTPLSSQSPKLKVGKSKSPRKSTTPSKSSSVLTPTKSKSPISSPRQRSLMEMFSLSTTASTSKITPEFSLAAAEPETRPTDEILDSSPACEQRPVHVEVLVEDSQMGPAQSSPVHVAVDTQESMFVDETPPNSKSSDSAAAAADADGTPLKPTCDIDVVIADTRDVDSFLCGEASQQTVVHADDADETVTVSVTPLDVSDATDQREASDIGEVSTLTVTDSNQASNASMGFSVNPETSPMDCQSAVICTDNMSKMSRDDITHSQTDVIDDTQAGCLDLPEHAKVDDTQVSNVDHIQRTADGTQNSNVIPTLGNYLAHTQPAMLDNSQPSSKNSDDIQTDSADDVPLAEMMRTDDAGIYLGSTDLSTSKDDDEVKSRRSMASLSVRLKHRRRQAGPKTLDRDSKDAIHATLQGRVTRSITETRPTRLNLRTRSVRRLTDKLVSVGAKKVDGIPTHTVSHLHTNAVRKRGRPKGLKSHGPDSTDGQLELEMRSSCVPRRTVSRRHCKSVWMRVAAAETAVAAASVDNERHDAEVVSDGMKSNHEANDETAELQSGIDLSKGGKAVHDSVKSASDDEVPVGTEKHWDDQNVDEAVDLNTEVEPATGEVPTTEFSGKPDSGLSSDQETSVGEDDVVESCGRAESDKKLSHEMIVSDSSEVELTDEEQASSRPSEPSVTVDVIANDSHVDTTSISPIISSSASGSELTNDNVEVPDSALEPDDDDDAVINMRDTEPTATEDITDDVSKTQTEVEKATPPSDVECQWKVPMSSVTRAHPAPPETPTSIPRRRFTSRGSLMLERSIQLRQSATSSPPVC